MSIDGVKLIMVIAFWAAACDAPPARDADVDTEVAPDTAVATPPISSALRAALERRLSGPASGGDTTWFSQATANSLRSVDVDSGGNAIVDFHDLRPLIPNASSSAGSQILLDDLNEAVFEIPGIASVEYRMDGSCDLFWEWLQYGCERVRRADYRRQKGEAME